MKVHIKRVVLFLFLLMGYAGYGQTIYEIKYSFNKVDKDGKETNVVDKEYDALLFYNYSEETNTMRVRYYDDVKAAWIIVEQKIKTAMYTQNQKQYWALVGTDAVFISKMDANAKYYPDKIVLAKNPDDKYYSPAYATSAETNDAVAVQTGKIISFTTLVKADITDAFLLQFGWKWPEDKQQNSFDFAKSTLYLIQVTNSLDESLGLGFSENHNMVKRLFSQAAQTCKINFKSIEVMGYDFNKATVTRTIADFVPGPNDIVIFYYSGHGFRFDDQKSDWPRMFLAESYNTPQELIDRSMSLDDDVYKPLAAKGAHLLMVFGECCNTSVGPTPTLSDPIQMIRGEVIIDPTLMKTLLKQSGNMLLATSKPNESTWYYKKTGGYFGTNLIGEISRTASFTNTTNKASWKDIIDNSMKETVNITRDGQTPAVQDPILYFEIK